MQSTDFLRALGDEVRLRTFRALVRAQTGLCVAEVADVLRRPSYAVSRGLVELRKAGLVDEERRGKFVYYEPKATAAVRALGAWVADHCECDEADRNPDGSTVPGARGCAYDDERLRWRLSLREPSQNPVTHPEEVDTRPRVLFVCVHNSARSQLAEEYLRLVAGDRYIVESAGLTPGVLNPHVVAVLADQGIDIAGKATRAVGDLYRRGRSYDWVVTVCSRDAEENCPVFPGPVRRLSWPFPDPSTFVGSPTEVREQVRQLAADIRNTVEAFAQERLAGQLSEGTEDNP